MDEVKKTFTMLLAEATANQRELAKTTEKLKKCALASHISHP